MKPSAPARSVLVLALAVCAFALAACDRPQRMVQAEGKKMDQKAWDGAADAYVDAGWKAGDQASWEAHLRNRMQGQNEYNRVR
jgi:hypothetical protein